MSWKRPPIVCDLNGVPITVEEIRDENNRDLAEYRYPGYDEADLEDMGGAPRMITVRGSVSGADWLDQVSLLESSVTIDGQHRFQHPFSGIWYGRAKGLTITHNEARHNRADVELTFVAGRARHWSFTKAANLSSATAAVASALEDVTSAAAALGV